MPVHTAQLDSLRRKALLAGWSDRWDAPRGHAVHARAATMPLGDLNPRLRGGFLLFDCPACCCQRAHAIRVALAADVSLHDVTVEGLIDVGCWRGRIAAGEVVSL